MARMAVVIAGPVWVWFVIICAQGLEWNLGKTQMKMNWKENAPPLVLWGILALSGLLALDGSEASACQRVSQSDDICDAY